VKEETKEQIDSSTWKSTVTSAAKYFFSDSAKKSMERPIAEKQIEENKTVEKILTPK